MGPVIVGISYTRASPGSDKIAASPPNSNLFWEQRMLPIIFNVLGWVANIGKRQRNSKATNGLEVLPLSWICTKWGHESHRISRTVRPAEIGLAKVCVNPYSRPAPVISLLLATAGPSAAVHETKAAISFGCWSDSGTLAEAPMGVNALRFVCRSSRASSR